MRPSYLFFAAANYDHFEIALYREALKRRAVAPRPGLPRQAIPVRLRGQRQRGGRTCGRGILVDEIYHHLKSPCPGLSLGLHISLGGTHDRKDWRQTALRNPEDDDRRRPQGQI